MRHPYQVKQDGWLKKKVVGPEGKLVLNKLNPRAASFLATALNSAFAQGFHSCCGHELDLDEWDGHD